MLNDYSKCVTDMGTDNSSTFGDCPKAKKSKTSDKEIVSSYWAHLPELVLHDIFDLLSKDDRKNASLVCKHWRQNIFHPKWWPSMTFKIEQSNLAKARFYTSTFSSIISEATIKINSLSLPCMDEFCRLLGALCENNNLRTLIIEPTHCRFEIATNEYDKREETNIANILKLLKTCLPKLSRFSIGCLEDFSYSLEEILKTLSPSKVTHLGLASVKDDPGNYLESYFNPSIITPFKKLEVLSIDYDHLSDAFLANLDEAVGLKRLVVHLHGIRRNHPGTSEEIWNHFYKIHPECEFRLTIIHAFNDIHDLDVRVLRKNMRLSHLKVFFCENVNMNVLENVSSDYHSTIKSIMWIDSLSNSNISWKFATPLLIERRPDPLVLIAWLCKNLEEIVLYGYKYCEENLVAIGRLRGEKMKTLEIFEDDIVHYNTPPFTSNEDLLSDIPKRLRKPWAPIKRSQLHPVICSPTAGDSDEYLLPIVLADLH